MQFIHKCNTLNYYNIIQLSLITLYRSPQLRIFIDLVILHAEDCGEQNFSDTIEYRYKIFHFFIYYPVYNHVIHFQWYKIPLYDYIIFIRIFLFNFHDSVIFNYHLPVTNGISCINNLSTETMYLSNYAFYRKAKQYVPINNYNLFYFRYIMFRTTYYSRSSSVQSKKLTVLKYNICCYIILIFMVKTK